ncbi:Diphthamide biosynthesis protein 2 [Sparganum proliferum]
MTANVGQDVSYEFEVESSADWINQNKFLRVGLQFPTDLLEYSIRVHDELRARTTASIVILGDTPYSSCCIDELAGERWGVDAIIHYGNACLSATVGRVPFRHVFGRPACPALQHLPRICHQLATLICPQDKDSTTSSVLFACDFRYQAAARQIAEALAAALTPHSVCVWLGEPATGSDSAGTGLMMTHAGRRFSPCCAVRASDLPPTATTTLVYLGACDAAFYRVLVTLRQAYAITALTIDPQSGEVAPAKKSAAAFLRRRYHLMEKAKEAKRIGILIGTLSTQRYTDVTARLKRLLKAAHKSYLTLVVGRINEAKLLNIPHLGALVLIACPESSLFDDPSIPLPIVTPYELECALHSLLAPEDLGEEAGRSSRIWQGDRLWLDFADILPGGSSYVPEESICGDQASASGDSVPERQFGTLSLTSENNAGDNLPLVLRDEANWSLALACEDLSVASGCWRGLDPRLGETEVARIQPGRSGLPVEYRTAEK